MSSFDKSLSALHPRINSSTRLPRAECHWPGMDTEALQMTAAPPTTPAAVPALPRAAEVRETVAAVAAGLKLLKGLATALERAERAARIAGRRKLSDSPPAASDNNR